MRNELLTFISGHGEKLQLDVSGWPLEEAGYPIVVSRPSASDPSLWNVESQLNCSPLSVTTPYFVERLVRLAAENDAEFDGWGTSI